MVNIRFCLTILLILIFLTNCISVSRLKKEQARQCELVTKEMELSIIGSDESWSKASIESINEDKNKFCVGADKISVVTCAFGWLVYGTTGAASLIVSGSIVVAGNTIHWIEKKGKCSENELAAASNSFIDQKEKEGGKKIEQIEELIVE